MEALKELINEKFEESFKELQSCWIAKIASLYANIAKTFFKP